MIPFDFEYYRPDTVDEAVQMFTELAARGLQPKYFSGGTEIITMARVGSISFGALIDIKQIPECAQLRQTNAELVLGSALPLACVVESDAFHLLSLAAGRVADHTAQHKITLGGNAAGTVIYHEAALPLLAAGCRAALAGPQGRREVALKALYAPRISLQNGELITHFIIPVPALQLPCVHIKLTDGEKIGYPLVTAVALRKEREIVIACAGIQPYPVLARADAASTGITEAVDAVIAHMPQPLLSDSLASGDYRRHMLRRVVAQTLAQLGGAHA